MAPLNSKVRRYWKIGSWTAPSTCNRSYFGVIFFLVQISCSQETGVLCANWSMIGSIDLTVTNFTVQLTVDSGRPSSYVCACKHVHLNYCCEKPWNMCHLNRQLSKPSSLMNFYSLTFTIIPLSINVYVFLLEHFRWQRKEGEIVQQWDHMGSIFVYDDDGGFNILFCCSPHIHHHKQARKRQEVRLCRLSQVSPNPILYTLRIVTQCLYTVYVIKNLTKPNLV